MPQNIKTEDKKENKIDLDLDNQTQLQNQQTVLKENKIKYIRKSNWHFFNSLKNSIFLIN